MDLDFSEFVFLHVFTFDIYFIAIIIFFYLHNTAMGGRGVYLSICIKTFLQNFVKTKKRRHFVDNLRALHSNKQLDYSLSISIAWSHRNRERII